MKISIISGQSENRQNKRPHVRALWPRAEASTQ